HARGLALAPPLRHALHLRAAASATAPQRAVCDAQRVERAIAAECAGLRRRAVEAAYGGAVWRLTWRWAAAAAPEAVQARPQAHPR
ncbi:hypothetical protein O6217_24095, partial [Salmonella enterica subsp. enterica]